MSSDIKSLPICDTHEAHHEIIDKIELPDDEHFFDLAEFFSVMGDSTRIKILYLLFEGEMCVCDISEKLGMSMSAISHQLRVLKIRGLSNTASRASLFSILSTTITSRP